MNSEDERLMMLRRQLTGYGNEGWWLWRRRRRPQPAHVREGDSTDC